MSGDPLAKFKNKNIKITTPTSTDPLAKFKPSTKEATQKPIIKPMPKMTPAQKRVYEDELAPKTNKEAEDYKKLSPLQKIIKSMQGYVPPKEYLDEVEQTAKTKAIEEAKKPSRAFQYNLLDTASFGTLNKGSKAQLGTNKGIEDIATESNPIISTAGDIAGYMLPFSAAKGALVKGTQTLGKRLLTDAAIGAGIDTTTELVRGENDLKTAAKNVALNAVFGIAADGALTLLGKAGKEIGKKFFIPKDLEVEIKREVGAFKIDADGNVFKNGQLIRKLNKGGGGDIVSAEGKKFVDQYGNVKGTAETDLQLPQPKPISQNEWVDSLAKYKTVPGPDKAITEMKPFENIVNKTSVLKTPKSDIINTKGVGGMVKEPWEMTFNEYRNAYKQNEDVGKAMYDYNKMLTDAFMDRKTLNNDIIDEKQSIWRQKEYLNYVASLQKSTKSLKTKKVDPNTLIFREKDQNNLTETRKLTDTIFKGRINNPIVTVKTKNGIEIIDGHNRTVVAMEKGIKIPTVTLAESQYKQMVNAGFDDMEISYAALENSGENFAAESLSDMFRKLTRTGDNASEKLKSIVNKTPLQNGVEKKIMANTQTPSGVIYSPKLSTTTQKGLQPTQRLIPTTLQQQVQQPKTLPSSTTPQLAPEIPGLTKNAKETPNKMTVKEARLLNPQNMPQPPTKPIQPLKTELNTNTQPILKSGLKQPAMFKKNLDKFYSATVDNTATTAKVSKEAEIMSNVTRNAGATVDTIINKGLVNMEGQKIEGKAIAEIFKMPKQEAEAFENLLFETHNIDRVKQGKELTGKTTEESMQIIADIKKQYPHLEEKAKEINTLLKNMLDEWGVKSGLVDGDLRNLVQSMYKNYVPGYRELNGVGATSLKSRGMGAAKIINRAIGGDDKLMSLQKSIPMLINKTIKSARKNELYREILKAANEGSPYARVLEPVGKIEEVLQDKATKSMLEAIKADGIDALANITDSALSTDPKLGYMLTAMDNGKAVKLQISEDLFKSLQALNGKGDDDLQTALKLFKKGVTNPFKSLITGYNPMFAIRNVARDIPTAYIQGTENNPIKFIGNLGSAAKDMIKKADGFQEYKALGGEGGNYFNVEKGLQPKGKLEKVLKPLGAINNFTESLPRYAEYKGTLKREGTDYATKMKALNNAQEVTVNFGRHGDVTKAIDAIVPYLNPAVQGLDKTARTFKKPEAWAKALGVITVPTAAIYAINQVVDKEGYDQLDNRTKDTYFVFPEGNGKFIKIPKTRESGAVFGALFERILRQTEGQQEAFKGYSNTIKNNFLIQNPWTDNIAAPLVSGLKYNKDFADRDVIPQYMLNDKRSPKLQYDEKTSEIAKSIGNQFNLSPKQIDYIIRSYGGIVASIVQPATTKGGNVLENVVAKPFKADAAYNNEVTNNFYKKLDKLKQSATDKNITQKLSSKLVTPEEKMSNLYQGMSRYVSDVRDGITQLGSTDEARIKQQELLNILESLNKDIDYNEASKLKAYLVKMANEYKK
jgi:hypothetical protein